MAIIMSRNQNQPRLNISKKSNQLPPTFVQFPVILEDLGTGAATFRGLGPTTNRKVFKNTIGEVRSQRPLANNRWLIGCVSSDQQKALAKKTSISQINIKCSIPSITTEGVIKPIPLEENIQDLLQFLPTAKSIHRLRNRDGTDSRAVRIIFNLPKLPETVKIDTETFVVGPFVAPVKRCKKCARLGHTVAQCRAKKESCTKCSASGHSSQNCEAKAKCINCGGEHSAAYQGCPQYHIRLRANRIRGQDFLPYAEAIRRAKLQLAEEQEAKKNQPLPSPPQIDRSFWQLEPTQNPWIDTQPTYAEILRKDTLQTPNSKKSGKNIKINRPTGKSTNQSKTYDHHEPPENSSKRQVDQPKKPKPIRKGRTFSTIERQKAIKLKAAAIKTAARKQAEKKVIWWRQR